MGNDEKNKKEFTITITDGPDRLKHLDADTYFGESAVRLDLAAYFERCTAKAQAAEKAQEIIKLLIANGAPSGRGTVLEYAEMNLMLACGLANPRTRSGYHEKNEAHRFPKDEFNQRVTSSTFLAPETAIQLRGIISLLEDAKAPSGPGTVLAYAQGRLEERTDWKKIMEKFRTSKGFDERPRDETLRFENRIPGDRLRKEP